MTTPIDTDPFSATLRQRGIDVEKRQLRISLLRGSEQEEDLSEPTNCDGFGRVRHFHRASAPGWPPNPLPIEPAVKALSLSATETLEAQVFQNAVCNWRCWYCYVDFPLLAGNPEHSAMLSVDDLLERYLAVENRPRVIDLSGGQPDLVPEWIPWMMEALTERGLDDEVYLWSDDNLSNDYFWTHLGQAERDLLSEFANYGKVCCFKGFDATSFAFNTMAAAELFERQFELMARLVNETAIDLYAYATFTSPDSRGISQSMEQFVDRLQEISPRLPLRLVPLRIEKFAPMIGRIGPDHEKALLVQEEAVSAWQETLAARFSKAEREPPITEVRLER
jgi:uncharacterized Fe-S cluster-containing radical SAM superfamily protein